MKELTDAELKEIHDRNVINMVRFYRDELNGLYLGGKQHMDGAARRALERNGLLTYTRRFHHRFILCPKVFPILYQVNLEVNQEESN